MRHTYRHGVYEAHIQTWRISGTHTDKAYMRHTYRQGHTHLLNGVLELIAHAKVKHARFALTVFIGFRVSARFALTVFIHVCVYVSICMHTQTAHNHPQNTHTHTRIHTNTHSLRVHLCLCPSQLLACSLSASRTHALSLVERKHSANTQRKHSTHMLPQALLPERKREREGERGLGFRV
jgi:hypothetical protein